MSRGNLDRANIHWLGPTVLAIVAATFFSDFGHEMCTAVLPLYLGVVQLGPWAIGLIEGVADLLGSLAKFGGGYLGHRVKNKRAWAAAGYVITALATGCIALVQSVTAIVTLRSLAWMGRGFRGPLRDALLAEAVPPSHYGRAYGLERAGDMLGAVAGPAVAILLLWFGMDLRQVMLWAILPGLLAGTAMYFFVREQEHGPIAGAPHPGSGRLPLRFWWFLGGILLFGLGDFSRTFLIYLVALTGGDERGLREGAFTLAVGLYALHNLISALVAYPVGFYGDRRSKPRTLLMGYCLGVMTNILLAASSGSLPWLILAVLWSGIYIAIEETLEKAAVAEMLPREFRSLGFGVLSWGNAIGDMVSSLYVGWLLQMGRPEWAFGIAAAFGILGVAWLAVLLRHRPLPMAETGVN